MARTLLLRRQSTTPRPLLLSPGYSSCRLSTPSTKIRSTHWRRPHMCLSFFYLFIFFFIFLFYFYSFCCVLRRLHTFGDGGHRANTRSLNDFGASSPGARNRYGTDIQRKKRKKETKHGKGQSERQFYTMNNRGKLFTGELLNIYSGNNSVDVVGDSWSKLMTIYCDATISR